MAIIMYSGMVVWGVRLALLLVMYVMVMALDKALLGNAKIQLYTCNAAYYESC